MSRGPGRDGRRRDASRPMVFLDKDGTLIEDLPYNVDPRRIRLAPGARDGIRALAAAGYRFAIVTNQSGVARGYFGEAELEEVRAHLAWVLEDLGAQLEAFYFCPHVPEGVNEYAIECECRKPLPGLVLRAGEELGVDLTRAWFIGDAWMDVMAGRAAGCRTVQVGPEAALAHLERPERRPDHAVPDLRAAARVILAEDGIEPPDAGPREARERADRGTALETSATPVAGRSESSTGTRSDRRMRGTFADVLAASGPGSARGGS